MLTAFVGPLPLRLMRDESGEPRLKYSYRTAEEFVLAAADYMRTMGRRVEVEYSVEYGIELLSAYASAEHWTDHMVQVMATRSVNRRGARWSLRGATEWSRLYAPKHTHGYRAAKILVEVYGR